MWCIQSDSTDPYFNLAAEEYLLKQVGQDVCFLYRNVPSIVVGKHQNTLAEINLAFTREKGLLVARRISGGGAVYHDLQNLNFAFMSRGKEGELVDYPRYLAPVIQALAGFGLEVSLGKRNELLLGGAKISGTASHVYRNRVLHHGTLLFNTDLQALSGALGNDASRFKDRAVKSVPSRVTNIRDHLEKGIGIGAFQERFMQALLQTMKGARVRPLSQAERTRITGLRDERFSTWDWNYGYSPRYRYEHSLSYAAGNLRLQLEVEKGMIKSLSLGGDFSGLYRIGELEALLVGTIHNPEALRQRLEGIRVSDYIAGISNEDFLSGFF